MGVRGSVERAVGYRENVGGFVDQEQRGGPDRGVDMVAEFEGQREEGGWSRAGHLWKGRGIVLN
jgi:hypothetical protein